MKLDLTQCNFIYIGQNLRVLKAHKMSKWKWIKYFKHLGAFSNNIVQFTENVIKITIYVISKLQTTCEST